MTWSTEIGDRFLTGHEARLVRKAVDCMHDKIVAELDGTDDKDDVMPYGVPEFDRLTPAQKLATLEHVACHLLTPTERTPGLTALTAGTVAAIFSTVGEMVTSEVTLDVELRRERDVRGMFDMHFWRKLLFDVAHETGCDPREVPSVQSRDYDDWDGVLDSIIGRVLQNDNYMKADKVLDAAPEAAQRYREKHGIEESYFISIASDPNGAELKVIRERLRALCQDDGDDAV